MAAVRLAWQVGADAVEVDVHLTADNEIVCIHDATTERVSRTSLTVAEVTWQALQAIELITREGVQDAGPARIPLLSEVLASVPEGKLLYIELKSDVRIVPYLLAELEQSDVPAAQIFIISFYPEVLKAVKAGAPELRTGLLVNFKRAGIRLKPSMAKIFAAAEDARCDDISVKAHPLMLPKFAAAVRKKGYGFHVWTVDDPAWAMEMLRRGAQSITTNKPDLIRHALDANVPVHGSDGKSL